MFTDFNYSINLRSAVKCIRSWNQICHPHLTSNLLRNCEIWACNGLFYRSQCITYTVWTIVANKSLLQSRSNAAGLRERLMRRLMKTKQALLLITHSSLTETHPDTVIFIIDIIMSPDPCNSVWAFRNSFL